MLQEEEDDTLVAGPEIRVRGDFSRYHYTFHLDTGDKIAQVNYKLSFFVLFHFLTIYTLNSLSFVNVKFQGSRSFRSVKRVYYNLIVQMFNQFRDTGLPS